MMASASPRPRTIVLGNEKGGSGKSTTALHVIVALLGRGFAVGSLDLDARQGTLSRALANREAYGAQRGISLPMPLHRAFRLLLADPRFRDLPMVLESPKGEDLAEDRKNLSTLRSLLKRQAKAPAATRRTTRRTETT